MSNLGGPWFALRTETGREKRVDDQLKLRDFESFVPLYREVRPWRSERRREVERAIFPGYLFTRFDYDLRFEILNLPGVINVLAFDNRPALVADSEIANLRQVVATGAAEPCNMLKVGQWVTITFGPYAGIRGRLERIKSRLRLVVGIEMFGRGVAVEVESCMVAA